ncbi:M14 family metallopeptidase [Mesobacillus zeae]|uniref:LysM peptidoglycan-binding domain-containing protein n=1 Tax=Mesobacillus zeae TaxID=1917180 RepID=A0A398B3H6_9BACI|nr:M14 family metallopeptidase [Mesobacillus zeae]RID84425.1 LysM peptidoglycan-binding domain-containing protein [Mesobacillus zeae]
MDIIARRGDSFWYYSQLFNTRLQLIIDSNRGINPLSLQVGQRVRVPGFVAVDYQVKPGDTLWEIAKKRSLPIDALQLANQGLHSATLLAGQNLKIPQRITWRLVEGKKRYDHSTMMYDLGRLERVYPFLGVLTAGTSVLGKPIPEVLVGNGPKRVHMNASFHGNEWITTSVGMTFLNDYLLSLTNKTPLRGMQMDRIYGETSLSFVPMVNPDGVNLVLNGLPPDEPYRGNVLKMNRGSSDFSGWKANIRGVDLNDQFPALWEREKERIKVDPGPRDYGGEKPLSEPEAIAMANLTRQRNFSRVLAFHTQGKVIYWGFENLEPPESETIVREFGRVSGYQPVKTVDSYAGYKDWFIQDWRRPGFTVEMGRGVNPLPLSQFDEIYRDSLGIFLAALYM